MSAHGTAARYVHGGCRCQPCRDANAARMRPYLRQRIADARERREAARAQGLVYVAGGAVTHGIRSTYSFAGCRCDPCREAAISYQREWRQRRSAAGSTS